MEEFYEGFAERLEQEGYCGVRTTAGAVQGGPPWIGKFCAKRSEICSELTPIWDKGP